MVTRAQKVRLGVFLAGASALLVGTLVVLTGIQVTGKRDTYSVRYTVSLSGLEAGAPVKYNGVRVGRVETIHINRDNVSEVLVTLSLDEGTPVKKDTKAVVNVTGITGLKYIELSGGTSASDFAEPGSEIEGGESVLDRLTGHAETIAARAEAVLEQLREATTRENRERVLRVADDVDKLVVTANQTLADNREDVRAIVASMRTTADGLATTVRNVERESTATLVAVRKLTEGLQESVDRQQVGRILGNIEKVTGDLRQAVEGSNLATVLKDLSRVLEAVEVTVVRSKEKVSTSLTYLQEGLENFSEFARIIRENPSLLLGGKQEQERDMR
jgi:phospholipid/cholesterol/gamma-HCH transport system substrate-binding protein